MWWWILLWVVVIAGSAAALGLIGVRVFRSGMALAREIEVASDRVARLSDQANQLAAGFTPEESAVFDDPARLRAERRRRGTRRREHSFR